MLQLLAGLCEQTAGTVCFDHQPQSAAAGHGSSLEERMQRVGLVFQFPERHFLGNVCALSRGVLMRPETQWLQLAVKAT